MLPIAYYLLKVIICSGILLAYYWQALRNKIFHHYNRFYLLAAVLLSVSLPVIKINFWESQAAEKPAVIKVLQVVSDSDIYLDNVMVSNAKEHWYAPQWDTAQWAAAGYSAVTLFMLLLLLRALFTIYRLAKKYPKQQIGSISFVNTEAKSTPFSFLNYIFWNRNIDAASPTGKQIFKHEVVHVQEKHTHDKLFINLLLAVFWCNPFFWLIRRELNMIHEFIADKKAVEDSDTAAFAAMILQAAYPQHRFQLTNNFFYSPIKRRLAMLVKNNNSKVTYFGRMLVLPLAILVFAAFTFKAKKSSSIKENNTAIAHPVNEQTAAENLPALFNDTTRKAKKKIIKAAGSSELYFIAADSVIMESSLEAELGKEDQVLFILNGKEFDYKNHPGIKINARLVRGYGKNNNEAIKKYGSKASNGVLEFYDAVVEEPVAVTAIPIEEAAKRYDEKALVIIDGKEAVNGKEELAKVEEKNIDHIYVLKDKQAIEKYGAKGTNGVIEIYTKNEKGLPEVLYVVDGIESSKEAVNKFKPEEINAINVIKGKEAVNKYGEKGNKGVIEVSTKNASSQLNEVVVIGYPSTEKNALVRTEKITAVNDKYPLLAIDGIHAARMKYEAFKKSKLLTAGNGYEVESAAVYFSGTGFPNVVVHNLTGNRLSQISELAGRCTSGSVVSFDNVRVKGLNGYYATIDGLSIALYDDNDNKIFTKTENPASFAAGEDAWKKYLMKNIDAFIPTKEGWKPGNYTIIVEFVIRTDGTVSNVTTNNYHGSKTAQHCIDLIKNAGNWKPAIQNGCIVNSYRRQPITFSLN